MSHLTIKLLGSLGRRFGQTHQLEATRLNEGVSYLRYQFAEFEQSILELDRRGIRFSLVVQTATGNLLIDDPTGLHLVITQDTTLIIAPVPAAAGDAGKFILGIGLIAVSAFLPGSIGIFGATISSSTIGLYGAGLVLGSVICEGSIKGLTNQDRSIWINGTPIRNIDNSPAYQGIIGADSRRGYQNDAAFPSPWNKVLGETTVNQKLTQSLGPATRRINNSQAINIDKIRIRLYWDRCQRPLDGPTIGASTAHKISIKEGNGPWQVRQTQAEYIFSDSPFEKEFEISVGDAPYYEIKVERDMQDDSVNGPGYVFSTAYWKSFTTVINSKLRYPNTAKVSLEIDLEKFGASDVQRVYEVDGKEILIPNNATVRVDGSLDYVGIWSGNFITAWSSDPAWCLYDLITNNRYGCRVNAAQLDKYAFYACSSYCAALIADGYGSMEPRFNLNAEIKDRDSAYNLVQKLAGVFNAIAYHEAGSLIPVVDRPLSVKHQFTNANATFSYAGTPYRNRRNRAVVSYTRSDVPNNTDYEIYEDRADILKRGVEELRIDATQTCTSRGQAQRIGKWAIYSEQAQKESITIQTGLDGALVRPGDIIQVGDRDRAGLRRWGRIETATINTLTLDSPLTLPAGTYTISCTLPDATLVERTISSITGSVVTISPNFATIPDPQASWLIAGTDLQPSYYRVISRAEPETHRFEILALLHDPNKYAAIEQGQNFVQPPRSVLPPSPPLPPQNLVLTPSYGIDINIGVAWSAPNPATYTTAYQLEYTIFGQSPVTITTSSPAYLIPSVGFGDCTVRVRTQDTTGDYSGWIVTTISIDVNAYFASCYLADIVDSWFENTISLIPEISAQTTFSSPTYLIILNP